MTARRAEPDEGVAALALIRAYATRDMFTARHILARWDNADRGTSFAAVVASTAATVLSRVASGDRNEAARQADEALTVRISNQTRTWFESPSRFGERAWWRGFGFRRLGRW